MKLITWWNYFYLWLNFHWKITGVSKHRITDAPMSKNTSESATDHYARVFNNKFGLLRIGIIIIFGCLGTLQDRWNIWTFGIKVYNKHNSIEFYNNHNSLSLYNISHFIIHSISSTNTFSNYLPSNLPLNGSIKFQNNAFQIRLKHCSHKSKLFIHNISNSTRYWEMPLKLMVRMYNYQRNVKALEELKDNKRNAKEKMKHKVDVDRENSSKLMGGSSNYNKRNVKAFKVLKKRNKEQTKHKIDVDLENPQGDRDFMTRTRIRIDDNQNTGHKMGTHWMMHHGGEATAERPGLEGNGLPRKSFFFGYIKPSKMIRSCLRGIGPGGCVLPRWEVFNHFAYVVLTSRSDGELLYEMTANYRLMRCLGSTWNSQLTLQHDASQLALSTTVFSRKCMRTHVVYLRIEIVLVGVGRGCVVNGFQPRYSSNNWWPTYLSPATEGQLWSDRLGGANSVYRLYAEGRAHRRTLEALRDDAKEQAEQDGNESTDTQLRNVE